MKSGLSQSLWAFSPFPQVILSSSCLISICVVSPLSQSSLCLTFPFKYISTFLFFFSRVSFISVSLLTLFLHGDFLPADNFFLHPSTAIFHISSSTSPFLLFVIALSPSLCNVQRFSLWDLWRMSVYSEPRTSHKSSVVLWKSFVLGNVTH